jgi:hypothetical protein
VAQGANPVGELNTSFDAYPGIEQFTVEVDRYAVVDGKYLYFDLPFTPSLFAAGEDRRVLPLFVSGRQQTVVRTEVNLPPGFQHIDVGPKSKEVAAPAGSGSVSIEAKSEGGKYTLVHRFDTIPALVKAEQYPQMLALESGLRQKSSRVFLLQAQ